MCVWGEPSSPIDLLHLPSESRVSHDVKLRAKEMKKLYEQVRNNIEKTKADYKVRVNKHRKKIRFNPGDLVWLHLRKERFSSRRKNKLLAKGDRPFKIIEKRAKITYKL